MSEEKEIARDVRVWYFNSIINFGDLLTVYILNFFTSDKLLRFIHSGTKQQADLVGIGSLLQSMPQNFKGHIWTSGSLRSRKHKKKYTNIVWGVRGPLTKQVYVQQTIAPVCYGDGGLLLGFMHQKDKTPRYMLGIVPHYVDEEYVRKQCKTNNNIIIISTKQDPEAFMTQLKQCKCIISSSLHGIIAADALGIPNRRFITDTSTKIIGANWKFNDYYAALQETSKPPLYLKQLTEILFWAAKTSTISDTHPRRKKIITIQKLLRTMTRNMISVL